MDNVASINSFGNRYTDLTPEQRAKRKDTEQKVATSVGATGAGAAAYQAKRTTVNRTLQTWFANLTNTTRNARQNAAEVTGLFGKFKQNVTKFSGSIINKAMKFQDMKFIGPIVKSPVMRGVAGIFGGAMAFFALITGIDKAYRNGRLAVTDVRTRFGYNA
jgi:hypothetical protein